MRLTPSFRPLWGQLRRFHPRALWRRHFPLRLAVTTAALLAATLAAMLLTVYVAAASLLIREVDARGLAALEQSRVRGRPLYGTPRETEAEHGSERREYGADRGHPTEYGDDRDYREHWLWGIRAQGPEGLEREPYAWLWPRPGDVRVARLPGGEVVLAEPLDEVARTLAGLRWWLGGVGLVGTALVSGVAFRSARRAFRPLEDLIDAASQVVEAQRINPQTLAVRVPPAEGDETLERLADLFNAMLARVGDALAAQARFVDDASHELRTPISALRADLEVALGTAPAPGSGPEAAEAWRQTVQRALSQVMRLSRLADDLLVLARYERGGQVRPVPGTDVVGPARQALADVRHLAEQRGVTVLADMPEQLPARCDGPAVARLLTNLLRNAIEASPEGGVVQLKVGRAPLQGPAGGVVLEVADAGCGMTPEEAARAFEPFFRGARPATGPAASRPTAGAASGLPEPPQPGEGSGTGLGLAIVKAIVDGHGGSVSLDSAPGQGTRVRVWLPDAPPGHPTRTDDPSAAADLRL